MSDDLISRKTLKRAIDHDFYEHYTKYHDTDQRALIDMVMDDIDEMPTAFDKEKVIKDLEKHKKLAEIIYHNDSTERHFGESIAYQKVIDMIHKCKSSIRSQTMKLSNLNRGNR